MKIPPGIEPCVTYLVAMTGLSRLARDSDRLDLIKPGRGLTHGLTDVRKGTMLVPK